MIRQPKDSEATARRFHAEGISFLMIKADGSKAPIESWEQWQDEIPTVSHIAGWFGGGKRRGVGMICGSVSGNLEAVDLESIADRAGFEARLEQALPGILARLVIVQAPSGGRHYIYRCAEPVEGNQKLAMKACPVELADLVESEKRKGKWTTKAGDDVIWIDCTPHKIKCLIETRGEGGYVVAPGSPACCHKLGRPYELAQGHYSNLPTLTAHERAALLDVARSFNEYTPAAAKASTKTDTHGSDRPGDDFSDQATAEGVAEILKAHGWQVGYISRRGHEQWIRPGKAGRDGTSATLFSSGIFHVFSSNAHPFEPGGDYTPFDTLALLQFAGNFSACALKLAQLGYGRWILWLTDERYTRLSEMEYSAAVTAGHIVPTAGQAKHATVAPNIRAEWNGQRWSFERQKRRRAA